MAKKPKAEEPEDMDESDEELLDDIWDKIAAEEDG